MKGLLLKDWYTMKSYCRSNIFIIVLLSIASGLGVMNENVYFAYYSCIFAGITTVNLIAYEEKEKWEQYAATLPYTKAQMVSSKYIVSLCLGAVTIFLIIIMQFVYMAFHNTYNIDKLSSLLSVFVPLVLLFVALLLPFIYKFGVNKGRIAYFIVIGISFGAIAILSSGQMIGLLDKVSMNGMSVSIIVIAVSLAVYALSWALSIHFYKNREI